MPFFLQATTATSDDATWTDTSTLSGSSIVLSQAAVVNTTTDTTEAAFAGGYTIPAGTLAVGDVIHFSASISGTTLPGSKDYVEGRVRLGGVAGAILSQTNQAVAGLNDGDTYQMAGTFRVDSIGAAATGFVTGELAGWRGQNSAAGTPSPSAWSGTPAAFDTTGDLLLTATYQFSDSAGGNVATLNNLLVWVESAP